MYFKHRRLYCIIIALYLLLAPSYRPMGHKILPGLLVFSWVFIFYIPYNNHNELRIYYFCDNSFWF